MNEPAVFLFSSSWQNWKNYFADRIRTCHDLTAQVAAALTLPTALSAGPFPCQAPKYILKVGMSAKETN